MKHIFTGILGVEAVFTTKIEDFIKHTGPKITYTKQPLQNEFFIRSNDLLFEQGINDFEVRIMDWEGVPCFFETGDRSTVPYDLFSASFYLLSRYEEYLPHVKDIHGRFPPSESVSFKNGFLQMPVVDIWAFKLLKKLKERFPDIDVKERKYKYNSIIDVTSSHCFACRGFARSFAGFLLDLGNFRLRRVAARFLVWLNLRKDPYDNYLELIDIHKNYTIRSMFFFQFAEYSTYDKNISPNNNRFKYLIKSISDYSIVSLAASYSSANNIDVLADEKKRLANVINRPVRYSRLRYNRVDVPETYRNLVDAEFTDDYTMGYTHEIGFRAGTCTPFYFYDISLEIQQPIKIHPFAVHDYALVKYKDQQTILANVERLYSQVKEVQGNFVTIFSNELLGEEHAVNWLNLYSNVIKNYHV
ncbi:polysaccharide deacetylase family protein [Spongiimicrobium sp. 3-5]|uniref:polysaccharide deacetylase family protein n=1 Tax=Spongiimicrobium sp. 3-5 TaxID=3332596 RepID=UPI00397EA9BC